MKRFFLILGIVFVTILLFVIAYKSYYTNTNKIVEDISLKNNIIEKVETLNEIDFSSITDFPWDIMYIFPPYSEPNSLFEKDKVNANKKDYGIEYSDNIYMIAFVNKGNLASFVNLPIKYINNPVQLPIKLLKEETKFNISKEDKKIILK